MLDNLEFLSQIRFLEVYVTFLRPSNRNQRPSIPHPRVSKELQLTKPDRERTILRFQITMNFVVRVNKCQRTDDLCKDCPDLLNFVGRHEIMNENGGSNTFVILIQIYRTEFHVDKDVRTVRQVSKSKNLDDMRMFAVTKLFDRS